MLGVSFGELVIVVLVAVLALKPGDLRELYLQIRKWLAFLNQETGAIKQVINEIAAEGFSDDGKVYDTKEAMLIDVSRQINGVEDDDTKK